MKCRFSILLFFGVLLCGSAVAQPQNWLWANSGGSKGYDQALSIAVDTAGNVFVAGFYTDSAVFSGTTIHSSKGNHFFLAKYSSTGILSWIRFSPVKGRSQATGVCISQNKYLYLTGYFTDSLRLGGALLYSASGTNNFFLAKYDLNGSIQWATGDAVSGLDLRKAVSSDAAGNAYVCGSFSGSGNFFDKEIISKGSDDIFLTKFDPDGNVLWAKSFGSKVNDGAYAIGVSRSGKIVITGSFGDTAFFGVTKLAAKGTTDIFLAAFDAEGNSIWARQANDTIIGSGKALAIDADENIYLTGEFGNGTPSDCDGFGNIYIAKYSSSGEKQWSKCAGNGSEENGNGISVDSSGNIFVTGGYDFPFDFGTGPLPYSGIIDVFIAKFNPSGIAQWADQAGGVQTEYGTAVATTTADEIFVGGYFGDTCFFGPFQLECRGSSDAFIAKIGARSGIKESLLTQKNIFFYPNPAHENISISFEKKNPLVSVELFSILGMSIKKIILSQQDEEKGFITISLVGLSKGSYLCRITGNDWHKSEMLIVE
jgi:hypothetical protein